MLNNPTPQKDIQKTTPEGNFKTFYALSFAWQLGFLISVPIAGFLFLGYLGDVWLKTSPLLLLIGLFAGVVITVYEVYHLLAPLITGEKPTKND